jgi:geranylgeranyl diphosphate synthase type I
MTDLSTAIDLLLPAIDQAISFSLDEAAIDGDDSLRRMLRFHMGWEDNEIFAPQGKRVRPLLVCLCADAVGGEWRSALPAAAAVEILHNFSLIHDDIEDHSETRRGRTTLWKIHGVPLALNAGDAMFTLVFFSLTKLSPSHSPTTYLQANEILSRACLNLTKGQHLDISFENWDKVSTQDYFKMITGKTAALLAAGAEIGALLGGAELSIQAGYHELGLNLGLAFQIHDDILGIWGDPKVTGKSASTDLLTRKKTLPILYGLENSPEFAEAWRKEITPENSPDLADILKKTGAFDHALTRAEELTQAALNAYERCKPTGSFSSALTELINYLIQRSH